MDHKIEEYTFICANGSDEDGLKAIEIAILYQLKFSWIYTKEGEPIRLVNIRLIDDKIVSTVTFYGLEGVHQYILRNLPEETIH